MDSTPITGLPEQSGRVQKQDLFLTSKKVDDIYQSMKLTYSNLTSSICCDVIPMIPKQTLPIFDTGLPLTSKKTDQSYSSASVTKFYDDTQSKITNLDNNKLDRIKTSKQTVAGPVDFNGVTKCPTSTANSGKEVVNIDYLNNKLNSESITIKQFWVSSDGNQWYKIYSNGWLEQGGYSDSRSVIMLKKKYKNSKYNIQVTRHSTKSCGEPYRTSTVTTVDSSYFHVTCGCNNHPYVYWETKGMGK